VCTRKKPRLVEGPFRRLAGTDVALTLNIPASDLRYLIKWRHCRRFFACDEDALPEENARANVKRVYQALGIPQPKRFASMAVRTAQDSAAVALTLVAYGSVVLELDLASLGHELVIFNGDVKDLGFRVAGGDNALPARVRWDGDRTQLATELSTLVQNARNGLRPRLVGRYFEARLQRALVPKDIETVYVDPQDQEAVAAARRLCLR
jgi:hypothetical protein